MCENLEKTYESDLKECLQISASRVIDVKEYYIKKDIWNKNEIDLRINPFEIRFAGLLTKDLYESEYETLPIRFSRISNQILSEAHVKNVLEDKLSERSHKKNLYDEVNVEKNSILTDLNVSYTPLPDETIESLSRLFNPYDLLIRTYRNLAKCHLKNKEISLDETISGNEIELARLVNNEFTNFSNNAFVEMGEENFGGTLSYNNFFEEVSGLSTYIISKVYFWESNPKQIQHIDITIYNLLRYEMLKEVMKRGASLNGVSS